VAAPQISTASKVFSTPLSLQSKIISTTEANGLAQLGGTGLTEYVIKQIPGMDAQAYRLFDNSIVVSVNGGMMPAEMVQHIRGLVAQRVTQSGFKLVEPQDAQAGIASVLSPFQTPTGHTTWELLLVVFDRAKFKTLVTETAPTQGLQPVFQAAIRGIVVHLFPETDLKLSAASPDQTTLDGLRIMFDKAFTDFMQPLASELQKTTGTRAPAAP
jgi:hypothetical protein